MIGLRIPRDIPSTLLVSNVNYATFFVMVKALLRMTATAENPGYLLPDR